MYANGEKSKKYEIIHMWIKRKEAKRISPIHPIWPYENVSLCEIDSGSEEEAFKNRRGGSDVW